jgi:hypothetical protein
LISNALPLTDRRRSAMVDRRPPRLNADAADALTPPPMFLQSAVDMTGARVGLKFEFVEALHTLCKPLRPFSPTMVDPSDTAAAYLDSGHLDKAEAIYGTILAARPDDNSARCPPARARVVEYLARVLSDLAFMGGYHWFDHVIRELIDAERFSQQKIVIFIHDCLALEAPTAEWERKTRVWTGEACKVLLTLRGLDMFTVAIPPSGLRVVLGLDLCSTASSDNFDVLVAKSTALIFDLDQNRPHEHTAMIPNQ